MESKICTADVEDVDIANLALCAWKEARGEEQPDGCQAVMFVIVNRVGTPGFASNLHDVIYGKNQFTSMSVPTDAEYNLQPESDNPIYKSCQGMAEVILKTPANIVDITNGAHYYANLHTANSGWFYNHIVLDSINHPITAQIGRHTFFR